VYEYDVAKVVENFVVTETILVDLMNVDDSGRRWMLRIDIVSNSTFN